MLPLSRLRALAEECRFDALGVSRAERAWGLLSPYRQWLALGFHGRMDYLSRHLPMRQSPGLLMEGTASIISVLLCYRGEQRGQPGSPPRIAQYAWYRDYHSILKDRLYHLLGLLQGEVPGATGRPFVDSAPLNDRYWAVRAGLGWIGKNGLLVTPRWGSMVWIGSLLVSIPIEPTPGPMVSRCGPCRKCLQACPNGALRAPRLIDATRCIAYQTIELREPTLEGKPISLSATHGWAFGCDECQLCCPYNAMGEKGLMIEAPILTQQIIQDFAHGKGSLPKDSPLQRPPRERLRTLLLEGLKTAAQDK